MSINEYLKKPIIHAQKRVNELRALHGNSPTENYNYYGGQSLGYWQGKLSAYEDMLCELEE